MKNLLKMGLALMVFLGVSEPAIAEMIFRTCVEREGNIDFCKGICQPDLSKKWKWGDPIKRNDPLCEANPKVPDGCYCPA